jgi:RHS repeat-associated protein
LFSLWILQRTTPAPAILHASWRPPPASQTPTVSQCQGVSGTSPSSPVPSASGTTFVVTSHTYSSGGSGNLLTSQATSAVTHSGSTSLLEFDSLSYDDNNNLTSSTPKVSGTAETADNYAYDNLQRVAQGPETSGSKTSYSYVSSTGTQPFFSTNSVDGMGIDAMPEPGSSAQLGAEYAGNGELCWVAVITSTTTGSCATPGSTSSSYETASYNSSGDLTGTTANGDYGTSSAMAWNADLSQLTCVNPSGTTCTGPSSSQPSAMTASYQADGLRTQTKSWNSSTSSVVTTSYTWDTRTSAVLSSGTFDYLYGMNPNVPIAQLDTGDSVTSELVADPSSNVRGIVEISAGAAHPDVVANYTDYDAYGSPMTKSGGSVSSGGLTVAGETSDRDSATTFGFGGGYEDATGLLYLVHRYYAPGVGQFMSVDSALPYTESPYSYAYDDPPNATDPIGEFTLGICGMLSASIMIWSFVHLGGGWNFCLVRTVFTPGGNDDIGFTETRWKNQEGVGVSASAGVGYQISNGNHISDLAKGYTGWFGTISLPPQWVGLGLGPQATAFWGKGTYGQHIWGGDIGAGAGVGTAATVGKYTSWTYEQTIRSKLAANALRILWDSLIIPGLNNATNIYQFVISCIHVFGAHRK